MAGRSVGNQIAACEIVCDNDKRETTARGNDHTGTLRNRTSWYRVTRVFRKIYTVPIGTTERSTQVFVTAPVCYFCGPMNGFPISQYVPYIPEQVHRGSAPVKDKGGGVESTEKNLFRYYVVQFIFLHLFQLRKRKPNGIYCDYCYPHAKVDDAPKNKTGIRFIPDKLRFPSGEKSNTDDDIKKNVQILIDEFMITS